MADLTTYWGDVTTTESEPIENDEATTKLEDVAEETTEEIVSDEDDSAEEGSEKETEQSGEDDVEEEGEPSEIEQLIQELASKEVIDFDPEAEYELTTETLTKLISDTKTNAKASAIEEYKTSMVGDGKELFETLEKGGTVDDFLISKQEVDYSKVQLETPDGEDILSHQRNIIEDSLIEQGFDKNSIFEMIAEFEESGKLKVNAERHKVLLANNQIKTREARIEASKIANEKAEAERMANAAAFKEKVLNLSELGGFQIPAEARQKLHKYITEVDSSGQTGYAKESTEDTHLLNAYLTMIKYDKEKLAKSVETKITNKIRKKLSNYTNKNSERKSESSNSKKDVPIGEFKGWK